VVNKTNIKPTIILLLFSYVLIVRSIRTG